MRHRRSTSWQPVRYCHHWPPPIEISDLDTIEQNGVLAGIHTEFVSQDFLQSDAFFGTVVDGLGVFIHLDLVADESDSGHIMLLWLMLLILALNGLPEKGFLM